MSFCSCLYSEISQLKDKLISLAEEIAAKYAVNRSVSSKMVIKLLIDRLCERSIIQVLRQGYDGNNEIDKVWRNLHDYAISLLVERLKNEIASRSLPISIINEADNPTGRYDILLVVDRRNVQILNSRGSICLEAKTGLNISLSQSEKYMWNGTTVILVRFATGDVITLRTEDWAGLLRIALRDRIEKAKRILDGKAILVPGGDCYECPLHECKFNKNCGNSELTRPHDINGLFDGFRRNACTAIENAVKAAITELEKALSGEMRDNS